MPTENFDTRDLRRVLGSFVTGVTVVTTVDTGGKRYGLTANSFSSVSLDPPLVLWSQSLSAPSHPAFRDAERFAISILAEHQIGISQRFATKLDDKFEGVPVTPGLGGIPLIDGCAATLECSKVAIHTSGDHAVFIGRIDRIDRHERKPLVFGGGRYLVAHPHDLGELSGEKSSLKQVLAVRVATPVLCELAAELDETLALAIWTPKGPTVVRWEPATPPPSAQLRMGLVPVLASATGRLFAAFLPREDSAALLQAEFDGKPPTADIDAVLDEVRRLGHSMIEREATGAQDSTLRAIAVPVFDANGAIVLTMTALRRRDAARPEAELLSRLAAAAQGLSQRLGHRG